MPRRTLKQLLVLTVIIGIYWTYLVFNSNIECLSKNKLKQCKFELSQLVLVISLHFMIIQYLRLLNNYNNLN